jgi:hypothetical protein
LRFSITTLLVVVTVIATLLAALVVMDDAPAILFFVGLLCLMPAVTSLVAVFGRESVRAGGIVATLFQLLFWLFFWQLDQSGVFIDELRQSLYWYTDLVTNDFRTGAEMKTWFVFVGIMTTVGGIAGAAIHRYWLKSQSREK